MLVAAPEEEQQALFDYGYTLGLSFQLVDDLLDFTSSTETLRNGAKASSHIAMRASKDAPWALPNACFHVGIAQTSWTSAPERAHAIESTCPR